MLGMYEVGGEVAVTEESYICHKSETQNWFFCILSPCWYFTIILYLCFSVRVVVSTHLCVIYCNFSLYIFKKFIAHSKYKASKYIDSETNKKKMIITIHMQ